MVAETSQTLDRGLRVLAILSATPSGLNVSQLAERLGTNRTVLYRLVTTLEQHRLVRRDASGRLHIGVGVLALAQGVHPVLRAVATPLLRALADSLGATAHLTVADGDDALAVAVVEPTWTDFHVSYRVGARHPLDQGAAGKAILLARQGGAQPDRMLFAETAGELQSGARGLAAPVPGVPGLEASVGIVTLGKLDAAVVAGEVVRAAEELGRRLG